MDEPLFSCQYGDCAAYVSYPAGDLRMAHGKRVCAGCYDHEPPVFKDSDEDAPLAFYELPGFVPEYEAQVQELEQSLQEAREELQESMESGASWVKKWQEAEAKYQTLREAVQAVRNVIAGNYPTPSKAEQCEHGRYGFEDCMACYDKALLAALPDNEQSRECAHRFAFRGQSDNSNAYCVECGIHIDDYFSLPDTEQPTMCGDEKAIRLLCETVDADPIEVIDALVGIAFDEEDAGELRRILADNEQEQDDG